MKSFVYEAKTLEEAIAKAWKDAGSPVRFYIKILEPGVCSWKWWNNSPAKIAFSYELPHDSHRSDSSRELAQRQPKTSRCGSEYGAQYALSRTTPHSVNTSKSHQEKNFTKKPHASEESASTKRHDAHVFAEKPQPHVKQEATRQEKKRDHEQPKYEQSRHEQSRHEQSPKHEQKSFHNESPLGLSFQKAEKEEAAHYKECLWDDHMLNFVRSWLSKISQSFALGVAEPVVRLENGVLHINMGKSVLGDVTRDKHLTSSLAVLLLETMRKQLKKNMRGCQIIIFYE